MLVAALTAAPLGASVDRRTSAPLTAAPLGASVDRRTAAALQRPEPSAALSLGDWNDYNNYWSDDWSWLKPASNRTLAAVAAIPELRCTLRSDGVSNCSSAQIMDAPRPLNALTRVLERRRRRWHRRRRCGRGRGRPEEAHRKAAG